MPAERVLTVRYEEFVRAPRQHLARSAEFLSIDPHPYAHLDLSPVSPGHIGKGRDRLSPGELALALPHMRHTLSFLGYAADEVAERLVWPP